MAVVGIGVWLLFLRGNTETYEVSSPAMVPTFDVGEVVTVDLDALKDSAPQLGDVVVFHPPIGAERGNQCGVEKKRHQPCPEPTPEMAETNFIKRVVAGPGDTLSIESGTPIVNGEALEEDYTRPCRGFGGCNFKTEITIPEDHYFMMGDNRGASDDSRYWGPAPSGSIVGRVEE